jgi:Fic family protein
MESPAKDVLNRCSIVPDIKIFVKIVKKEKAVGLKRKRRNMEKKIKKQNPTDKEVEEFLRESNAIEREYSDIALQDANQAWITGVLNAKEDFSIDLMCGLHRRLMKRLNPKIAGHIREVPVYVGNSTGYRECLKPELIKKELQKLFDSWNKNKITLQDPELPNSTKEMFVKDWHIKFEGIHPYEDGNGRTGRILMNLQRLMLGLPILIIHSGPEQFSYYKWFKELKKEK